MADKYTECRPNNTRLGRICTQSLQPATTRSPVCNARRLKRHSRNTVPRRKYRMWPAPEPFMLRSQTGEIAFFLIFDCVVDAPARQNQTFGLSLLSTSSCLGGFTKNFLHGKNGPAVCFCTRLMIIFANVPLMFPRRPGGPDDTDDTEHLSVNLKQTNIGNNEREKIHYL